MSRASGSIAAEGAAAERAWVVSPRLILTWRHLLVCALASGLFVYLNYLPALDSRIWLDARRGREILAERVIPAVDAAQPLSDGMRVIDTSWLSKVICGWIEQWGGPPYLAHLFALATLAYVLILARVLFLQTRRLGLMIAGVGVVLVLGPRLQSLAVPDLFGAICFALLLALVRRPAEEGLGPLLAQPAGRARLPAGAWPVWLGTGLLFVAWANLHASFFLGIVVLACYAVGQAATVVARTGSVRAAVSDRQTQRWVLLAEWAALASLVNPYGWNLALETWHLVRNENLRRMQEWLPLSLATPTGILLLVSLLAVAAVLRSSRRQVRAAEALLLTVFVVMLAPSARGLLWYAPVYALVIMPHAADVAGRLAVNDAVRRWLAGRKILGRWLGGKAESAAGDPKAAWSTRGLATTLLCGLTVWCALAFSPISQDVLGGKKPESGRTMRSPVPAGVVEYLRRDTTCKLIFAPVEWADYLVGQCPPHVKVFMTSDVQWVPPRVWNEYGRIARAEAGWDQLLQRYDVDTVAVGKQRKPGLDGALRASEQWQVVFEDDKSLVARRRANHSRKHQSSEQAPEEG